MLDLESTYADVLVALRAAGISAYVECAGGNVYTIRVDVGNWYITIASSDHDGLAHDRQTHETFEVGRYCNDRDEEYAYVATVTEISDLVAVVFNAMRTLLQQWNGVSNIETAEFEPDSDTIADAYGVPFSAHQVVSLHEN